MNNKKPTYFVTHFANGGGGTICPSKSLKPKLTKERSEVTCLSCKERLNKKLKTPEQLNRQRRMAGKRSALNPLVQEKFAGRILTLKMREAYEHERRA